MIIAKSLLKQLAVVCVLMGSIFAQSLGSIAGTVKDSKGAVIPGATVVVSNPTLAVIQTTQSNGEGIFVFPQLPAGNYTLSVSMPGFKKIEKSDVVLPTASKISMGDIVLEIGNLSETITVQAEAGQLQIQSESGERSN